MNMESEYFKEPIPFSHDGQKPVRMTLEEAVAIDNPEGTVKTVVSATLLKKLLDSARKKLLALG